MIEQQQLQAKPLNEVHPHDRFREHCKTVGEVFGNPSCHINIDAGSSASCVNNAFQLEADAYRSHHGSPLFQRTIYSRIEWVEAVRFFMQWASS